MQIKKIGIYRLLIGTFCLLTVETAVAAIPHEVELSVDKAVQLALSGNNSLARNQIALEASKRAADHAWNSVSPSLTFSAGTIKPNRTAEYDSSYFIEGKASVSLSPDIFMTVKKAALDYKANRLSYDEAVRTIEQSVRSSFFTLLYERKTVLLQQQNLKTAQEQYEQNEKKYRTGNISKLDVLSSKVVYEKLKPVLQSVSLAYTNDAALFRQLIGLEQNTELVLSGTLDSYSEHYLTAITDKKRKQILSIAAGDAVPALALLKKKIESEKVLLMKTRLETYGPSLSASYSYTPTTTRTSNSTKTADAGTLTLGVHIPLTGFLPWSAAADRVASVKDTLKDLELDLQNTRNSVQVQTDSYIRQMTQKKESIASQRANRVLAQETYAMTKEAYDLGTKDFLSLQNAADFRLEAQVSLESELLDFLKICLSLENILGIPYGTLGYEEI